MLPWYGWEEIAGAFLTLLTCISALRTALMLYWEYQTHPDKPALGNGDVLLPSSMCLIVCLGCAAPSLVVFQHGTVLCVAYTPHKHAHLARGLCVLWGGKSSWCAQVWRAMVVEQEAGVGLLLQCGAARAVPRVG